MMGWSPGCYILSFVEIGPPVSEKKALEGVLPYIDVVAILVMGPASCHQIFIVPESFHIKFDSDLYSSF